MQGDKNIYQEWSSALLFSQKLDNWKTCSNTICRAAQATEVCAASECNLHRMQNPFGAGTVLLDILLFTVTHDNALSQGHKPVNSFPVVENAQYLFVKIPHSPCPVKGESETFQKTGLYVTAVHPKNVFSPILQITPVQGFAAGPFKASR